MVRRELHRLVARCLHGDEEAWENFLQRYARLIWATVHRCGASGEDAEEIFQRTWVAIVGGLGDLKNPDGIVSWIVSIARHQTWRMIDENRRYRRRAASTSAGVEGESEDWSEARQEEDLLKEENGILLYRAMDKIGKRCRRLLGLLFLADPRPDYQEISEELGLAVGSIGPIRARCLARLKKEFFVLYQGKGKGDS